jgi:hypothetical protein
MAIAACNHFVVPADGPNPVRDILCVWSYWLARPDYRSESYELDCGMIFRETVPPSWIESVIPVGDAEFSPEKLGP